MVNQYFFLDKRIDLKRKYQVIPIIYYNCKKVLVKITRSVELMGAQLAQKYRTQNF